MYFSIGLYYFVAYICVLSFLFALFSVYCIVVAWICFYLLLGLYCNLLINALFSNFTPVLLSYSISHLYIFVSVYFY